MEWELLSILELQGNELLHEFEFMVKDAWHQETGDTEGDYITPNWSLYSDRISCFFQELRK